jgi:hypothetical protein
MAQYNINDAGALGWNSEIYNSHRDLNIVDDFKIRGIGRAGHIVRMYDERIFPPPQKK